MVKNRKELIVALKILVTVLATVLEMVENEYSQNPVTGKEAI